MRLKILTLVILEIQVEEAIHLKTFYKMKDWHQNLNHMEARDFNTMDNLFLTCPLECILDLRTGSHIEISLIDNQSKGQ